MLSLVEMIDSGLVGSTDGGTTRAEDAQGTPTQSHISPSILVYEENHASIFGVKTISQLDWDSCHPDTLPIPVWKS